MRQLSIFLLFFSTFLYSQNFKKVDSVVGYYPKFKTPESLAIQIQKDFETDRERTRAAFKWLTNNIRYSLHLANGGRRSIEFQYANEEEKERKLQQIKDQLVKNAFLRRIGVCEEYAQSLKKLCDLMGIESEVLKGNVRSSAREIGRYQLETNHAWNIVKIQNQWIIIDATWASGYAMNDKWNKEFSDYYFDIPISSIGKTHFPEDRKWQILWNIESKRDYYKQPIYYESFLKKGLSYPKTTTGILSAKRGGKLQLDIKGFENQDKIFVSYGSDRYSKRPVLEKSDFGTVVTIPAPIRSTEMYVFINSKLASIFRVILN